MIKKTGYILGIFGIAALCMLPNCLADTIFYDGMESQDLRYWSVSQSSPGVQDAYYLMYYHGHWGMRTYASSSSASYACADADISGLDTDSYYEVELYVILSGTNNHWLYVVHNGQINCVIDKFQTYTNNLTLRYGTPKVNHHIMTLTADTWYHLKFDVYPASSDYDLYVNGNYKATGGFDDPVYDYLRIGDDETGTSNYGYMVVDDVGVYQ